MHKKLGYAELFFCCAKIMSELLYELGLANGEKVQRFDEAIGVNIRIEIWKECMSLCFML